MIAEDDPDQATWEENRHRWAPVNAGTAPTGFWRFEPVVPDDLRDDEAGPVVNSAENRASFDLRDDARRLWLSDRGDWRDLLDE